MKFGKLIYRSDDGKQFRTRLEIFENNSEIFLRNHGKNEKLE